MSLNSLAQKFFSEFSSSDPSWEGKDIQLSFDFKERRLENQQYDAIEAMFDLDRRQAERFFSAWLRFYGFYAVLGSMMEVESGRRQKPEAKICEAYENLVRLGSRYSFESIISTMRTNDFDCLNGMLKEIPVAYLH